MDQAIVQYCTAEITDEVSDEIREMEDSVAASIYDARLVELEKTAKRSFIEMGIICLEVKRRNLYRQLIAPDWIDEQGVEHSNEPFHSLDAWIMDRLGVSRRSAYHAMKVLEANTPLDDLREMPRVNAVRLAGLSTSVQADPDIIEAAKGSERAFVEAIQEKYPDQHAEKTRTIIAQPTATAREAMDLCFEVVCWAYDLTSREDVLENLCAYFMDGNCEREGYSQYSNRNAYMHATGRQ